MSRQSVTSPPNSRALRSEGFTLVELVVVIIILGVLAAVAVPRLTDMDKLARVASVMTLAAAVRATADNFRVACLLKIGGCDVTVTNGFYFVDGPGQPYSVSWYGYPRDGQYGSMDARVQASGFTVSVSSATRWYADGAPNPSTCYVGYNNASAVAPYVITIETSGC